VAEGVAADRFVDTGGSGGFNCFLQAGFIYVVAMDVTGARVY
jgi:hypothetical protein